MTWPFWDDSAAVGAANAHALGASEMLSLSPPADSSARSIGLLLPSATVATALLNATTALSTVGAARPMIRLMAARLTPEERTARMRAIRKTDTKPELIVRRIAHRLGFRFRLYRRDLPGSPDLTFPQYRKVVLVHGCFWHQHEGCKLARQPRRNLSYWGAKLARNVQRDRQVQAELFGRGWTPLIIWECDTRSPDRVADLLVNFLEKPAPTVARPSSG